MKRLLGPIAAVTAVALLVVLSGCGGSSGSGALTKSEFVQKTEAICKNFLSEREEHIIKLASSVKEGQVPSVARREGTLVETANSYGKAADEIGELTPPAGDEKKVEALVAAMNEAVEIIKADPGTVLTNSRIAFKEADSLAERYGLNHCDI